MLTNWSRWHGNLKAGQRARRGALVASIAFLLAVATGASTAASRPAVAAADTAEQAEVDAQLANPDWDDLARLDEVLQSIASAQAGDGGLAGVSFDKDTRVVVVGFDAKAPRAADFARAIRELGAVGSLRLVAEPRPWSEKELSALAASIAQQPEHWEKVLAVEKITGSAGDPVTGEVVVYVISGPPQTVKADGIDIPIRIEPQTIGGLELQSRVNDDPPWKGGTRILMDNSYSLPDCTMGFTWRKWSSNELMGSSAEHCYEQLGASVWYNYSTPVGTRYYYNSARDTFLMRSNPIGSFSPQVWVGSTITTVLRNVAGAQASPVIGSDIALSGGASGLTVGQILQADFWVAGEPKGPFVRTNLTACAPGDSGGPWLTTYNNGDVRAHGQHVGEIAWGSTSNCLYMEVNDISAALSASIALAP